MISHRSFANMFAATHAELVNYSTEVHTGRWQGVDISKRPDMKSYELLNWRCDLSLDWITKLKGSGEWSNKELLAAVAEVVKPNLPWADDHFLERVGGEPLNPGVQWANWPWASSADKHRVADGGKFNHTYMERLWPKWAGMTPEGKMRLKLHHRGLPGTPDYFLSRGEDGNGTELEPHEGIRGRYGDLMSLVELLAREPDTRQAWIPLFFPEDTGIADGGRKPCTLGYQLIMRNNQLSMYYPLRSCDFVRHFRDDIYLALRLLLWVLDRCVEINPSAWSGVTPGYYAMHATSLHVFENDYRRMKDGQA